MGEEADGQVRARWQKALTTKECILLTVLAGTGQHRDTSLRSVQVRPDGRRLKAEGKATRAAPLQLTKACPTALALARSQPLTLVFCLN